MEYIVDIKVKVEAGDPEEIQQKIKDLINLMKQLNDIVLDVNVLDWYQLEEINQVRQEDGKS